MAKEHNPNSGSFFKNDYKKEDKHPDFTGTCNIDGKTKDIAIWHNPARDNKKEYYSFKISDKQPKKETNKNSTTPPQFDGDMPF